jgi:hypothetical protein
MDLNTWYPAQTLEKWGCIKLLKELDQCLATPRRGGGRARSPRATSRSTTIASASSRSNSNHSRVRRLQRPQGQGRRAGGLHRGLPARDHPVRADQRPGPRVAGRSVWLITQNEEFADADTTVAWVVAKRPEGDERSAAFCDAQGDPEREKYAAGQEVLSLAATP